MSERSSRLRDAMMTAEARAARWLVAHATALFWVGLVAGLICVAGFGQIRLRNDFRSFFDAGNPILERTDRLAARMGDSKETAILIFVPADGNALSTTAILQYRQLADQAKTLPFVVKAKSWFDAERAVALPGNDANGLPRRAMVPIAEGADLFSAGGTQKFAAEIAAMPTVSGRYVARDRTSATVILQLDLESSPGGRIAKLERLEASVAKIEAELRRVAPGDRVLLVGSTLFDYASTEVLRHDVKRLFPYALLIVAGTLLFLYRSILFAGAALFLIILPVFATGGVIAAAGIEFSTLAVSALMLVGTLAVADVVHIANSYFLIRQAEADPKLALTQALSKNFWAITATSSTTAIGEIALLFSAAPPVRVMGITVIIGVVIAWLLAVMMLPFVLLRVRRVRQAGASALSGPMARLSAACADRPWPVLAVFGPLLVVSVYGIGQSRIDDSMSAWFSRNTAFRQGMDRIDAGYLSLRTMTLATLVEDRDRAIGDSPAENRAVRAEYAGLQGHLDTAANGYWLSVVTAARAFARTRDNGAAAAPPVAPDAAPPAMTSRALSDAGLMTQYEPGKRDYAVWYFDPSSGTTFDTIAAAERIESSAQSAAPQRAPQIQGVSLAFADLSARNFWSIVGGSVAAFAIMTLSLAIVFGSWRLGLLSMLPNLAPLLLVYGAWGFLDGRINMAAVSVFSVACGIVVDDTIHLVMTFQRYRATGTSIARSVEAAMHSSGTGVLATTIVIAAGFFLLALSDFSLTAQKAGMVGSAICVAFLFDLFAMPALLAISERRAR